MRLHRFFVEIDFSDQEIFLKDQEIFNQIRKVLRLKPGDQVILFNQKEEILGEIKNFYSGSISFLKKEILRKVDEKEIRREIILSCALLKKNNFELVIQKATEIGVKEIQPLITQRTIKLNFNQKRLQKIIKEAAEQSGNLILPKLNKIISFEEALKKAKKNDLNLFFDPSGEDFRKFLNNLPKKIGLFIGPEGGWSEEERKKAQEFGFEIVNLGEFILRSETSAIVSSFLFFNF